LSQCRERVADLSNPLPFASCFICSGTGHLASSCPQNNAKGVYPNGGCCKICQQTDHLARDCQLRKKGSLILLLFHMQSVPDIPVFYAEVAANTTFVGTGGTAGADEDDFHTFKRTTDEVEREQKHIEKAMKMTAVKVGVHSGKPRTSGSVAVKLKKVVNF
jgi:zinc finger CCHC domain-containing protein 9